MFNNVIKYNEELFKIEENGKYGFKDLRNEVIIPPIYDRCDDFGLDEFIRVYKGDNVGVINNKGNIIVPIEYKDCQEIKGETIVRLIKHTGKVVFINLETKEILKGTEFEDAALFNEGVVFCKLNGKYGAINNKGDVIIPFEYDGGSFRFSCGMASVRKGDKYFYINKENKRVIDKEFDYAGSFSCSFTAIVRNGNKIMRIDRTGNILESKTISESSLVCNLCCSLEVCEEEPILRGYIAVDPSSYSDFKEICICDSCLKKLYKWTNFDTMGNDEENFKNKSEESLKSIFFNKDFHHIVLALSPEAPEHFRVVIVGKDTAEIIKRTIENLDNVDYDKIEDFYYISI